MIWSHRFRVVTLMEARDGHFDQEQEVVHAVAAQCQEFLAGAYRVVDDQRVLIWKVPAARPVLRRGLLTEELAGSESELLEFALAVSEEFRLDSWLPPGEQTAEGSYYRIGPSFPDFPPRRYVLRHRLLREGSRDGLPSHGRGHRAGSEPSLVPRLAGRS